MVETVKVEHSVIIGQPVEKVFTYLRNFRNYPQWRLGVVHAKHLTRGPTGVGTKVKQRRAFLGQLFDSTLVVTEYELNDKICFKTTSGPFSYEGCYTVKLENGCTRITFAFSVQPSAFFFFNVRESVFIPVLKRDIGASLDNLKDVLEA